MGSVGDGDNDDTQPIKKKFTLDLSDTDETQPFDSPHSIPGEKFEDKDFDDLQFLQNTLPFVDTVPLEDAFETQVMNFDGETQVLDDPDGVENMATQLLDEWDNEVVVDTDGEETDGTEVLGDTEELSDDDTVEKLVIYPSEQENKLCTTGMHYDGRSKAESAGLNNGEQSSELLVSTARLPDKSTSESKPGSIRVDFTSVRAAALRASGLAARSRGFEGTNSEPSSIKNNCQFSKQYTAEDNGTAVIADSATCGEEVDQEDFLVKENDQKKGLMNENKCRIGSSTVRRLFHEDTLAEFKGPDDDMGNADEGADLPQLPVCDNEMVGLSYVDSQEPGDLSQANALDFVDRYVKFNVMDFDQEIDLGRSTGGKSKPVSSAKGTQSLVKRTNLKIIAAEQGTFDWDDSREDEGGGEFFTKKKEVFFDSGGQKKKSSTKPQKLRHLESKGSRGVDATRGKVERPVIYQKVNSLGNSNSRLVLNNLKRSSKTAKVRESKSKKNLAKELDEQLNIGSSDGMEATGTDKHMPEMLDVGFDTQMAAEAMETLCSGLGLAERDNKDTDQGTKIFFEGSPRGEKNNTQSKKGSRWKRSVSPSSRVITRNSKLTKSIGSKLSKESPVSSRKQAKNVRKQCDTELVKAELKKAKSNAEGHRVTNRADNINQAPSGAIKQLQEERAVKNNDINVVDRCHFNTSSSGCISVKKRRLQEQIGTSTPIARRTRQCRVINLLRDGIESRDSKEQITDTTAAFGTSSLSYSRGKRTHRKLSCQLIGSGDLHRSVNQSSGQESSGQSLGKLNRSKINAVSTSVDLGIERKTRSSAHAGPVLPSLDWQSKGSLFQQSIVKRGSRDATLRCNPAYENMIPKSVVQATSKYLESNSDAATVSDGEGSERNARFEVSPGNRCKPSGSASTTPINCITPVNAASPICMGDEYLKQSCRKNLSRSFLMKEINSLISNGPERTCTMKDSRRRREMASVRVLFSHHLDEDIIKQQKKILARLGASVASSISESTHFITDKFVRTRNMLEAIAFGKPVVTHLWLDSCGQASCFIDERNYILRDAKKEKEFGFSLPVSLARACQHPLLQGQKVLITPNTKPGKEILASLVKAVHGMAVERIGRSAFKDDNLPDDLLVLSCEEDYTLCVPFLEKGAAVYSSELLLNGIVTQKLEYERHRLFADHVKKTRSTIWLKKDSNQYRPVTKRK